MPLINFAAREINYKIVYYGCGLCGKTTNIQYIHRKINPQARGKLVSIATEEERTLYFDFLPLTLGTVKGMQTRFHLYTVPGQSYYNASRKLVLQGVDGIIFVADSQITRLDEKEFTLLFHEGRTSNLHVSQVSDQVLLIITFGRETQVGKVRLYTQRAIEVLRPIFEGSDEENEQLSVDDDYEASAGKMIDDLFADVEGEADAAH